MRIIINKNLENYKQHFGSRLTMTERHVNIKYNTNTQY